MAISTYADLKDTVADFLNRADLTSVIPTLIALMESAFNKDTRARVRDAVTILAGTASTELVDLPADFLEMKIYRIPASTRNYAGLQFVTSFQMAEYRQDYVSAAEPLFFSIVGKQLRLLPTPGATYTTEMEYYAKVPALSDTVTTNWLLTNHPEIYLYGTLAQAEPYLKNDDRLATWMGLYDRAMDALKLANERAMYSGSPLRMRTRSFG